MRSLLHSVISKWTTKYYFFIVFDARWSFPIRKWQQSMLWGFSQTSNFVNWSYCLLTSPLTCSSTVGKKPKETIRPRSFLLFRAIHHLSNLHFPGVPLQPFFHLPPYLFLYSLLFCLNLFPPWQHPRCFPFVSKPREKLTPASLDFQCCCYSQASSAQSSVAPADSAHITKLRTRTSRILSQLCVHKTNWNPLLPLAIFLYSPGAKLAMPMLP